MALAPAQRLKKRVKVGSAKKERERGGGRKRKKSKLMAAWAPLQLAHYPAHCLILTLLIHQRDCQGGRASLSSLLPSPCAFSGETFSDCVCIFNVAWPFGLFRSWWLGRRRRRRRGEAACQRGLATMCTHFIHQCAAAQNDGNAKTNDDVCLSSLVQREGERERGGERASERERELPDCLPGGRNRLFWS